MKKSEVAPRFLIATSISNSHDHIQMEKSEVTPQETMLNLISGFWVVRSIYLAAELGIADWFDDHPKTIAQLAAATNTEPRFLYRLLRALASIGIFTKVSDQCFAI